MQLISESSSLSKIKNDPQAILQISAGGFLSCLCIVLNNYDPLKFLPLNFATSVY